MRAVEKYDCPLHLNVTKCEAGWVYLELGYNDVHIDFHISEVTGHAFTSLLEAVQVFHDLEDGRYDLLKIDVETENGVINKFGESWCDVPVKASFLWDEEPEFDEWSIERKTKDFGEPNFTAKVIIMLKNRHEQEDREIILDIKYKDLCYATAKCFTECLKKYGFMGFSIGAYGDEINIRQLLIIKAFALGLIGNENGLYVDNHYGLTFEEEIELLLMDM